MAGCIRVTWLFIIVAVLVLGLGLLAALGALGELEPEDDLAGAGPDRIPLALFGYRRDVVDRLLRDLREQNHRD